jgi:hypothetical protein
VKEAVNHLPQPNETRFDSTFPGKYLCQLATRFDLADRWLAKEYRVFDGMFVELGGQLLLREQNPETLSSREREELVRIMSWLAYGLTALAKDLQAQADGIAGDAIAVIARLRREAEEENYQAAELEKETVLAEGW